MKKSIFMVAAAALTLASCSNDAVVDLKQNEITFSVATENTSRAADIYCANNLMKTFNLWATVDGKTYINGDSYTQKDGVWLNDVNTRYWPESAVNFYAAVNGTVELNGAAAPTMDFTVAPQVGDQTDLLYSAKIGEEREQSFDAEAVTLNFRHALSQVVFKAKNTNKTLHVVINGVKVGYVNSKGTLTYPTDSTDPVITDHNQTGEDEGANRGTWATNTIDDFEVTLATPATTGLYEQATAGSEEWTLVAGAVRVDAGETKELTSANNVTFDGVEEGYSSTALLLLPTVNADGSEVATGSTTAWTPDAAETAYDGTYLAVNCEIWNIAGDTFDPATDVKLHSGLAVMPVAFSWKQGKKYTYTFVFGDGNGGYEDLEDPTTPEKPTPVLVPMTFEVSVDDFQVGDDDEVEMDTEE